MSEVRNIPLSQVDPSPNPLRDIDPDQLSDLTESVKEHKILQAILVRKKNERFEVVFGNHRYYAAKKAGLSEIPCTVRALTDTDALLLSLSENIHRTELNPVTEGEAYKTLLDFYSIKELSKKTGKTITHIQGRIKISEGLHPDLVKEIGKELPINTALQLSNLPRVRQLEIFTQIKKYKENPGGAGFGWGEGGGDKDSFYCVCPKCGVKHPRGIKANERRT